MSQRDVTYNGETIEAVMMGSYTLEMNYDPAMKVSEIRGGAEDLNMLERRILGRADGMNDGFDSAAKEFTEVVKWDISALSAEDLAVWMEVTSTLRFCAAITEEWADAVSEYKRERRRIINRWNEEAPAYEEDLEKTVVPFRFIWMETPAQKAAAALRALKEELEGEESTAYKNLDSISIDLLQDLKNGPTPEAVQRLIENGYINWSYFNLGGEVESAPIEVDPDEMAEDLVDYLDDPEGYDGDITLVTAVLGNIGLAAMRSQQEGSELNSDQILFLTNFYEALEEAGGEDEFYPGVLGIANRIPENPAIDETMREAILGALGDGILALSSENVGGAYSLLPESIRNTVEGPDPDGAYPRTSWISNAQALSLMMEHANPYLEGGQQFSANLTEAIARELDSAEGGPDSVPFEPEELENLLDVSLRNEEANFAVIDGENSRETLRGLYSFDWRDDGDVVASLTDWIWEYAESGGDEAEMAAEAAVSLIRTLGEHESDFLDTGFQVDGNPNAAVTELNGALAGSFSRIFYSYIDSFGLSYTGSGAEHEVLSAEQAEHMPLFEEGDIAIFVPEGQRQGFLQLLMANEQVSPNVLASAVGHEQRTIEGAIFGGRYDPDTYSNESGRLRDLVNGALVAEIESRISESDKASEEVAKEAQAKWETAYKVVAALGSGATGMVPVAGDVAATGFDMVTAFMEEPYKNYVSEQIEEEVEEFRRGLDSGEDLHGPVMGGEDEARWHIQLQVAHVLLNEGVISLDDLEGTGALVEGSGGDTYLPLSPNDWVIGHSSKGNELISAISEALSETHPEVDVEKVIETYTTGYKESMQERDVNRY